MTIHLTEAQERERLTDLIAIYRPASDKVIADKARMPGLVAAPLTISPEDMRVMLNGLAAKADATTSAASEVGTLDDSEIARIAHEAIGYDGTGWQEVHSGDLRWFARCIEKALAARPVAQADAVAVDEVELIAKHIEENWKLAERDPRDIAKDIRTLIRYYRSVK